MEETMTLSQPCEYSEIREQQRQHVIEVAAEAFQTDGIKSVTMDDVAHLLTMSKRTLYQLFRDKEELLVACFEWRNERERRYAEQVVSESNSVMEILLKCFAHKLEQFGSISPSALPDFAKYPRLVEAHKRCVRIEEDEAIAFMQRGIDEGIFRKNVDFTIIFPLIEAQMKFVMNEPRYRNRRIRDLFMNSVLPLVRGCATEKGIQMIDEFAREEGA